jgi:hypothetical protein
VQIKAASYRGKDKTADAALQDRKGVINVHAPLIYTSDLPSIRRD